MFQSRRAFLRQSACAAAVAGLPSAGRTEDDPGSSPIVDTHQHLWDLSRFKLLWLEGAAPVLKQSYTNKEYLDATRGLNVVKAVYMEVDVDPKQHTAEAEDLIALCRSGTAPTVAAVIGGRPAAPDFAAYLARIRDNPVIKGVRQVLHAPEAQPGLCLTPEFVRGVRLLGDMGLSFDLCMRPAELKDGVTLSGLCPETRFIVDHCGNADPLAFRQRPADAGRPTHDADAWKRAIEQLAGRPNTICKISGIVASAPKGWTADDLAPIVNHCLDAFGPDRLVFGGDWPVCLLGATYRQWVEALRAIVAERSRADQRKLWSENAERFYRLNA